MAAPFFSQESNAPLLQTRPVPVKQKLVTSCHFPLNLEVLLDMMLEIRNRLRSFSSKLRAAHKLMGAPVFRKFRTFIRGGSKVLSLHLPTKGDGMVTGGQKLRVLREKLGLTMRDIETASERIARKRNNEEYLVPISG